MFERQIFQSKYLVLKVSLNYDSDKEKKMPKKDNSNWTKEELIKRIEELEKRKKYGLVWEDKPEEVVEMCTKKKLKK